MAVQVASPVRDPIFRRPLSPMSALSALSRPPQPAPSPPRTNRPLPPVPPLNDTDFFSPVRTASPSPSSPVSPKRALPSPKGKQRALEALSPRSRPVSRATFASRRALTHVLKTPRTLENLLVFVPWADFHALVSTCGNFRRELMARPDCRDAILAQFVPGYRHARAVADIYHYRQVAVDFHDVALLVLSQFVPLHKYPLHTLSLCTDSPHTDPSALADRAARLATLSQAHSRFVLLLQALVHSTSYQPMSDELDADGLNLDLNPLASSAPGARAPQRSTVRELVFPPPLSYFGGDPDQQAQAQAQRDPSPASSRTHRRLHNPRQGPGARAPSLGPRAPPLSPRTLSLSPVRASGDFQALLGDRRTTGKRQSRRMSIFGAPKVPPPPPAAQPAALKYANGWRRSAVPRAQPPAAPPRLQASISIASIPASASASISASASVSDDDLKAPRLRFTAGPSSSESSLASPPSSRSNTDGRATPSHAGSSSPRVRPVDPDRQPEPAVPRGTSPHDLHLATSRARAPVLRVFVPCTALDDAALTACEAQLAAAGLWEHLSVGDVVCNLGYVPPAGAGAGTGTGAGTQVWLVFEGTALVPYAPPGPPPVADPLTLPSPFYYAHILPPFADPVFEIALPTSGLGLGLGLGGAELTLTLVPTRVRSPRSPGGWAVVRRYVWIARVPYVGAAGLGRGWRGEWMLEGEGTKEGRQSLLDALGDGPGGVTRRGRWMVVRDKSGGGRVWMKLLVPNVDHVHDITEACESVVDLPPPARTTTES